MTTPLSREFLLARGFCCNCGCVNCPYAETNEIPRRSSRSQATQTIAENRLRQTLAGDQEANPDSR